MQRRQFIKGSAIVGMSLVASPLLAIDSGMFYEKGKRQIYRILQADKSLVGTLPVMGAWVFPALAPLFWAISLLCIWARTALGIHFLGDVLAGWAIGAAVSGLALALAAGLGLPL